MEQVITDEVEGLMEMRCLIKEFLNSGEGSHKVREYISSVIDDDSLLLVYLKGRKHRVKHAWETLKRKAEVRSDEYPEVFTEAIPEKISLLFKNGIMGILKARDQFGRRILCFNAGKWNPSEVTLDQLTPSGTYFLDKLLSDEDVINNGLVCIQNCEGMGMNHARQYSFRTLRRQINIYYPSANFINQNYAYPIKFKAFYYLNAPIYYQYIHKIIKPFLSKKLNERLFVSTSERQFEMLHNNFSPAILPKYLGGVLENEDAFDWECFQIK